MDSASFEARAATPRPTARSSPPSQTGRRPHILHAWLENSFFAERVSGGLIEVELTDEALDGIADTLIYSRIGN
ncbi:MAG: hypothetical protein ACLTSG_10755 [Lachnospiraceae bacterium]